MNNVYDLPRFYIFFVNDNIENIPSIFTWMQIIFVFQLVILDRPQAFTAQMIRGGKTTEYHQRYATIRYQSCCQNKKPYTGVRGYRIDSLIKNCKVGRINHALKNLLHRRIRQFALETPDWATAIRYHSKHDEKYDLTLIARRMYGLPNEWPVIIMAAAGLKRWRTIKRAIIRLLPCHNYKHSSANWGWFNGAKTTYRSRTSCYFAKPLAVVKQALKRREWA